MSKTGYSNEELHQAYLRGFAEGVRRVSENKIKDLQFEKNGIPKQKDDYCQGFYNALEKAVAITTKNSTIN